MSKEHSAERDAPRRRLTDEEAEAILTLVRGGWLRLELTLDDSVSPGALAQLEGECDRIARAANEYDQAGQHEYAGGLREAAHHVRTLLPTRILAALALPYADHPDYREEWRL